MLRKFFSSQGAALTFEIAIGVVLTVWGYFVDTRLLFPLLIVLLCYIGISAKLAYHFLQEDEFFKKLPLLKTLSESTVDDEVFETIKNQSIITSSALMDIHAMIWSDYQANTRKMAVEESTGDLDYTLYVKLITNRIRNANKGESIVAVSFLSEGEFVDNPLERDFHKAQLEAKARAVSIKRIFISSQEALQLFKMTDYWEEHRSGIIPSYHIQESLYSMNLSRKFKEGFVMFHDQLFVDRAEKNEWLAGYLTVRHDEIKRIEGIVADCMDIATCISEENEANLEL